MRSLLAVTATKTIRGLVAAAATALLVTGCTTSSETEGPAEVAAPTTSETVEASSPYTVKEIGEEAGLDHPETREPMVSFTVDSIEPGVPCESEPSDPANVPVKVNMTVWTDELDDELWLIYRNIFTASNWKWIDANGVTKGAREQPSDALPYQCGDAHQFMTGMTSNTKYTSEVWLEVPEGTEWIILDVDGVGWKWEIPEPVEAVEATTPSDEAAPAPAYTAPAAAPTPAPAAPATHAPAPPVIGFTGAPGHDTPGPLDKTISHCGEAGKYQTGTTFFTDGTTGWTETCSAQMQG